MFLVYKEVEQLNLLAKARRVLIGPSPSESVTSASLSVPLRFTLQERLLLIDLIDLQIEGMRDARGRTVDDPTFEETEDYLSSIGQYGEDIEILHSIKERLRS